MNIKRILSALLIIALIAIYAFTHYGIGKVAIGSVSVLREIPVGLWKSEDPYLIMDITDDTTVYHHGKYLANGILVDVVVYVDQMLGRIEIYDDYKYDFSTNTFYGSSLNYIFRGRYKVRNDKLRYKIYSTTEEGLTKKTIIFKNERAGV